MRLSVTGELILLVTIHFKLISLLSQTTVTAELILLPAIRFKPTDPLPQTTSTAEVILPLRIHYKLVDLFPQTTGTDKFILQITHFKLFDLLLLMVAIVKPLHLFVMHSPLLNLLLQTTTLFILLEPMGSKLVGPLPW